MEQPREGLTAQLRHSARHFGYRDRSNQTYACAAARIEASSPASQALSLPWSVTD